MNFFCGFFKKILDKKCRPITFRWQLLFIAFLKLFSLKKSILLKLPHLITFYRDLINITKSILPLLVGHSLLYEDVTLCLNDILLNATLISTARHWIVSR